MYRRLKIWNSHNKIVHNNNNNTDSRLIKVNEVHNLKVRGVEWWTPISLWVNPNISSLFTMNVSTLFWVFLSKQSLSSSNIKIFFIKYFWRCHFGSWRLQLCSVLIIYLIFIVFKKSKASECLWVHLRLRNLQSDFSWRTTELYLRDIWWRNWLFAEENSKESRNVRLWIKKISQRYWS